MKKKIVTLFFGMTMVAFSLSAQTIKDNIDKQAKDKSTMDKSAKADVLLQKKSIFNSGAQANLPSDTAKSSLHFNDKEIKKSPEKTKTRKYNRKHKK